MDQNTALENDVEGCTSSPCIHPHAVRTARDGMPQSQLLADLSEFYKLFADGTRLRILAALGISELCVCDLSTLLDMKQPAISHQLRILKQARAVKARREGKVVYYSLGDAHIRNVLQVGIEHLSE